MIFWDVKEVPNERQALRARRIAPSCTLRGALVRIRYEDRTDEEDSVARCRQIPEHRASVLMRQLRRSVRVVKGSFRLIYISWLLEPLLRERSGREI